MSLTTSDSGQEDFWIAGEAYESFNTALPVKEEQFWYEGQSVEFLQGDPVNVDFLTFFFV